LCGDNHPGPPELTAQATLESIRAKYTKRELEEADEVDKLARNMGYPSANDLRLRLKVGVGGHKATMVHWHRARRINGRCKGSLLGKNVHRAKLNTPPTDAGPVPQRTAQVAHMDLFFLGGIAILIAVAEPLGLSTIVILDDLRQTKQVADFRKRDAKDRGMNHGKDSATLIVAVRRVFGMFRAQGFQITKVIFDGERAIAAITDEIQLLGARVVAISTKTKVGVVERRIRVIEERCRAISATLPYNLPRSMLKYLIMYANTRVNQCISISPTKADSTGLSPYENFTSRKLVAEDFRYGFGDFVFIHEETDNTLKPRARAAFVLIPNNDRDWYYMSIGTWSKVLRSSCTTLPGVPADIIAITNDRASKEWGRRGVKVDLKFMKKTPIVRDPAVEAAYDRAQEAAANREADHPEAQPEQSHTPAPVLDDNELRDNIDEDDFTDQKEVESSDDEADAPIGGAAIPTDVNTADSVPVDPDPQTAAEEDSGETTIDAPAVAGPETPDPDDGEEEDAPPERGSRTRYNLRPKGTARVWHTETERAMLSCMHISVTEAIRADHQKAMKAMVEELKQLYAKRVFHPIHGSDLTEEEWKSLLPSSMFLKNKFEADDKVRDIPFKVKGRLVAGGHKQDRALYSDEEISAPTVSTSAAFMVAAIAAREKRHVITLDIAGAYLNAKLTGKKIFMRLEPVLAGIMVKIDPSYKDFVRRDGTMFVQLDKALYGCLEAAKLWYNNIKATLIGGGFTANPKDMCVFNKTVNGVQVTVIMHVDDLKVTSAELEQVESVAKLLTDKYRALTIHRGKVHNYLGMTWDYSVEGKVKITMDGYVADVLKEYEVTGGAKSPAGPDLFTVTAESPALTTDKALAFRSRVAKLLYLGKRVRPDTLTAIGFLATRVQKSTEQDWGKLDRLLRYLNSTKDFGMILEAEHDICVLAYIDASFGVHEDAKSTTGVYITLGRGGVHFKSEKQKIVTKSSTEAELVGLTDSLSQVIWTRDFLIGQGYKMAPARVFQDNTSAMALAAKGRSTNDRTRHIHVRYFFAKDRTESGEITIEHMPTKDMTADLMTKPVQGELFYMLRKKLLNWE